MQQACNSVEALLLLCWFLVMKSYTTLVRMLGSRYISSFVSQAPLLGFCSCLKTMGIASCKLSHLLYVLLLWFWRVMESLFPLPKQIFAASCPVGECLVFLSLKIKGPQNSFVFHHFSVLMQYRNVFARPLHTLGHLLLELGHNPDFP